MSNGFKHLKVSWTTAGKYNRTARTALNIGKSPTLFSSRSQLLIHFEQGDYSIWSCIQQHLNQKPVNGVYQLKQRLIKV